LMGWVVSLAGPSAGEAAPGSRLEAFARIGDRALPDELLADVGE
jgi:hypothetical protein